MVSSRLFIASTTALALVCLVTLSSAVNAHPFPMERDFEEPKSSFNASLVKQSVEDSSLKEKVNKAASFLPPRSKRGSHKSCEASL